ncbi:MAG: TorF family putative porin [Sphingobium sp.]|jgi:uncharacterized protein (TIGR02001 family)|nr:TorF family putative porin [Sphingobium sp.]MCI1270560.1 TorF family putative porin [Sphingobium sp.]MCI1755397.1 TorF family putative porin [Sphingobium sp.]MCI2053203.1 TorF family putative porin [Sphingobium sp.]
MRNIILGMSAFALAAVATPALAEEATDGFTVTGGAALVSDYRFRGLSQSGEEAAVQGWATIGHESGFYAGFWGSSINFANGTEVDAIVGYSTSLGDVTVDGGVTYYIYPGSTYSSDVFEPYLSVSGQLGPVKAKVGAAYIFEGQNAALDQDNIYLYTDLSAAVPGTPLTVKGHYGYNDGFIGAGGNYSDYSIGAEASWKALTFGVSYVNTSGFANKAGKELAGADGAMLFTVSAAF